MEFEEGFLMIGFGEYSTIEDENEDETDENTSYRWSQSPANRIENPPFEIKSGPKNLPPNLEDPIDFFFLFYTEELNKDLTNKTNSRLQWKLKSQFEQITEQEMKNYTATLLFAGILGLKSFKDMLSFSELGSVFIHKAFPRTHRWWLIHNNISFYFHPFDATNKSKVGKMQEIISYLNKQFNYYYVPSEYIVVDEGMIPFKGRFCSFKQHLPRKPHATGKLF